MSPRQMSQDIDPEVNPEPIGRYQPCMVCSEMIVSIDGLHWTHEHGEVYCGTGDGAMAMPY